MKLKFIHFNTIDSTNNAAFALAKNGGQEGTVVLADAQSQGRGRAGNVWQSPGNCGIYSSFILRPASAKYLHLLGLVLGLAVVKELKIKGVAAALKWPNDILLNAKKIGGILAESQQQGKDIVLVLGLGLNVNTLPDELPQAASSLYLEAGREFDVFSLLEDISRRFFSL